MLFAFGVFEAEDIPFLSDNDWIEGDPWSGSGGGVNSGGDITIPEGGNDNFRWDTDGVSGLQLEILNALEEKWTSVLATAVQNWDNGRPIDSLTLRVTRIEYEFDCAAVEGKLKVCNGNYGNTQWRGLNEVVLTRSSNIIVSSTAMMNEYYLSRDSNDQLLYTMCHEVSH